MASISTTFSRPYHLRSSSTSSLEEIRQKQFLRVMAASRCTAIIKSGTLEIPCPCTRGFFALAPQLSLEVRCEQCNHFLFSHRNIPIDQSPTEGPAPVSDSAHTVAHVSARKGQIPKPNNGLIVAANMMRIASY
jgi:hypothetical protein